MARSALKRASIKYCLKDGIPYKKIEGEGLLNLLQECMNAGAEHGKMDVTQLVPCRTTISRGVDEAAEELKSKLFPEIKEAMIRKQCAAAIDLWTEDVHKVHFVACTVGYFVTIEKKLVLKNMLLFFVTFYERSTGKNLGTFIIAKFEERGFPKALLQNVKFCLDGGADINLALNEFERFYCFGHFLNVCLNNTFVVKVYKVSLYGHEGIRVWDSVRQCIEALHKKEESCKQARHSLA